MVMWLRMKTSDAFARAVNRLLSLLRAYGPGSRDVANPWVDCVRGLDLPAAADQRIRNLRAYLHAHRNARFMLVGQEAGYAGCRFSGIPFTGEDLLQGPKALPLWQRARVGATSALDKLMSERSANIVWPAIGLGGQAVLWNSFPFHCHEPGRPLTNRAWKPRDDRDGLAERILRHMVERTFPNAQLIAVGRKAEAFLQQLGYHARAVRHPSQGGASLFRTQIASILSDRNG
jgi:uracil-DNA glycosylase